MSKKRNQSLRKRQNYSWESICFKIQYKMNKKTIKYLTVKMRAKFQIIIRWSLKFQINLSSVLRIVKLSQLKSSISFKRKVELSSRKQAEIKCCNRRDRRKELSKTLSVNQPMYIKLICLQLNLTDWTKGSPCILLGKRRDR